MHRLAGVLAPLALAAPLLIGGCGGTGTEAPPPPAAGQAAATDQNAGPAGQAAGGQEKLVTPNRVVDPNQLSDVPKEEIEGGEAMEGPTPAEYLWQRPRTEPAKEEELTVEVPVGLPALIANATIPAYNPITRSKVELGKQLYFDPRVSLDGTVSCATCHNPEKGWTDQMPSSIGIDGQVGSRSAPTVLNSVYGRTMFWDGRAPSLEGQAQGPIQNPIEMGKQSYKEIIARLRQISGYQEQFQKVFGTDVTLDGMAKAIASFERTVLTGNSAYDKYTRGEYGALDESQKRGMVLFGLRQSDDDEYKNEATLKKANCTSCHVGSNFTDEQFHNLGVGWNAKEQKFADLGRWAIAPIDKNPGETGAFKTPMLRDLTRTAPYMHDGSETTLEAVVEYYDRGGNANPYLDVDMKKLNLTATEKADVVAFLKALTGDEVKVELPKLPVDKEGKSPDPRSAFQAPAPKAALGVLHLPAVR